MSRAGKWKMVSRLTNDAAKLDVALTAITKIDGKFAREAFVKSSLIYLR